MREEVKGLRQTLHVGRAVLQQVQNSVSGEIFSDRSTSLIVPIGEASLFPNAGRMPIRQIDCKKLTDNRLYSSEAAG